jgi:hypothetical protein
MTAFCPQPWVIEKCGEGLQSTVYDDPRPTTYESTTPRLFGWCCVSILSSIRVLHLTTRLRMSGVLYAVLLDCLHDYQLHVTLHMVLRVCVCVWLYVCNRKCFTFYRAL